MDIALSAIDKIAFKIGNLEVAWYGLIIVSAMVVGLIYILIERKRINLTVDDAVELFLWVIPLAVIFARICYVIVRPDVYFPLNNWDDFVNILAIWDGGITIIGGVLGGLLGILIFSLRKRKKANFGQVIDLVVPPLLIGQIIGRLGNFINQEAFGVQITNEKLHSFPFAVYIDDPSGIDAGYNGEGWYAATCFYEMAWNLVGLIFAFTIWRKNKKYAGILAFFYVFWYAIGRGMLEFIRLDAVPITQPLCFVLAPIALISGILYIVMRKKNLSFHKVNNAIKENLLYITEISDYDVKNYKFAVKVKQNKNNPLNIIYRDKEFSPVEIESMYYLDEPKKQKAKKPKRKHKDIEEN